MSGFFLVTSLIICLILCCVFSFSKSVYYKCNSNQCIGFSNENDKKNSKYNDYIKKRITFFMQYCCSKKLKRAIFMSKLIKYMYLCLYICVLLFFLTVNSFNIFKYFFLNIRCICLYYFLWTYKTWLWFKQKWFLLHIAINKRRCMRNKTNIF